jgi:purine-binding chemotaxis protein CheW
MNKTDHRYICFTLGSEKYSIPLLQVREVIAVPEFTRMPHAPAYFKGLLNLRGTVIATIDLRAKFGFPQKNEEENAVIVCEADGCVMGALVDQVDFVFKTNPDDLQHDIDTEISMKTDYIHSFYNHKSGLIIILDLKKVLNVRDVQHIKQPSKVA